MKKIMAMLTAVLLIMTVIPLSAFATTATGGTTGDCTWRLDGTVLTISGNGKMEDYPSDAVPWSSSVLTEVIIEPGVTSVGNYAFYKCSTLKRITLGNSVTVIGISAFSSCTSLTSITIPNSVTKIGESAFSDCSNLTSITLPNGIVMIGTSAFYECSNLTSITLPDSITEIGGSAFLGCSNLTSITLPNGITEISSGAFYGCSNLVSIMIPDSVTKIGAYTFYGCSNLASIIIPHGITEIDGGAFCGCSNLVSITIPDGVTYVGVETFSGCSNLTSITLPVSVTTIMEYAFYGCSALTDIWYTGNESDQKGISIGTNNSALSSAIWHYNCCSESMHTYDNACDATCNICGYIRQPDHVYDHSCDTTCNECGAVRSITHTYDNACDTVCNICGYIRQVSGHDWGEWVKTKAPTCDETGEKTRTCTVCGEEETADIPILTPVIVAEIGNVSAKRGDIVEVPITLTKNTGLVTLAIAVGYDSSVLEMVCPEHEDGGFCCYPAIEKKTDFGEIYGINWGVNSQYHTVNPYQMQWAYAEGKDIVYTGEIVKITFRVKEDAPIGTTGFSMTVTESYKANGSKNTCTSVSGTVTVNCNHVKDAGTVTKQPTCTAPGETVYKCSVCGAVMETEKAPAATGHKYGDWEVTTPATCTEEGAETRVCANDASHKETREIDALGHKWGEWVVTKEPTGGEAGEKTRTCLLCGAYETSEFYPTSGDCGVDLTWSLDKESGVLTISGSGMMDNYNSYNRAPWYSQHEVIQSVNMKDGVTTIGDRAFCDYRNLTSITIPDSITEIGGFAFSGCSSLTNITIPDSVTEIRVGAFDHCSSLTSITIPDSVTTIGNQAFMTCSNLTSITIPASVTTIGIYAFEWCSKLTINCYEGSAAHDYAVSNDIPYVLLSEEDETLIGDANNDQKINLVDVVLLARYVAEWDIECNEDALDVNGDGTVNMDDVVHLARYVAQWEGIVLG